MTLGLKKRPMRSRLFMLIDIGLIAAAFFIVKLAKGTFDFTYYSNREILIKFVMFTIAYTVFLRAFEMYKTTYLSNKEIVVTVILTGIYTFMVSIPIAIVFKDYYSYNYELILGDILTSTLICMWRILLNTYLVKRKVKPKLLIIEDKKDENSRVRKIKYFSLDIFDSWYEQIDVNDLEEVNKIIKEEFPRYGSVCLMETIPPAAKDLIIKAASHMDMDLFVVPSIYELNIAHKEICLMDDVMMFHIGSNDITRFRRTIKRAFDIVFSLMGMVLGAIPMLLIAAAIKMDSKGKIFYKQKRLTRKKKEFEIYKFRTMISDAEKLMGPVLADKDDPRITRVGRFLRKVRLDELPQLLNILKGEMSVVGPRPERPFFVEQYSETIDSYDQRFEVKAGLTSLSHVYGRYSSDIIDRTLCDLLYTVNFSLWLDLQIVLLTSRIVFIGKAAEGVDNIDYTKLNESCVTEK